MLIFRDVEMNTL